MNSDTRARGYKTFFMLNSAEHGILSAHNYEHDQNWLKFQVQNAKACNLSC